MKYLYVTISCLFSTLFLCAQWTGNTAKNLTVAGVNAADIQSIGIGGGKTWIAFYSQRKNNYDMRAQLLDSMGNKLLGDSGILVCKKPSGSATYVFNVCATRRGELIIGYQYEINGVLNAVLSKVTQSGSLPWGDGGVVIGPGLSPYPAALTTGETAVAWSNSTTNTTSLQVVSLDGTINTSNAVNVKVGSTTTTRGQVVANTNGAFTLVFQKNLFVVSTNLYAQRYTHTLAVIWPAPVQLSNETTSAARYYSVSAEKDTTYVGYYGSVGLRFNAFLQRINPGATNTLPYGINGSYFSTDTATNDNYQQTISIAQTYFTPTVWAVCTYSDPNQVNYGVYAQRFDKTTGKRLFGNGARKVLPVGSNGDTQQGDLQVTGTGKAGFIFIDNLNHIYATRLNQQGYIDSAVGTVLLASTNNEKSRINFVANDVLAVAVWSEDRGNGEFPFAQDVLADGTTGILPAVNSAYALSNIKSITFTDAGCQLYPNPAQNTIHVGVDSKVDTKATVSIAGLNGKILVQQSFSITAGVNLLPVPVQSLSAGVYLMRFATDNGIVKTMKFTKM